MDRDLDALEWTAEKLSLLQDLDSHLLYRHGLLGNQPVSVVDEMLLSVLRRHVGFNI